MRYLRFVFVGALGFAVQLGVIAALVHWAGVGYLVATAAGVSIAVMHNFAWHRQWTWSDRPMERRRIVAAFVRFAGANGVLSLGGNLLIMAGLVGGAGVPPLAANVVAIAACGMVNYLLADRVVFWTDSPA